MKNFLQFRTMIIPAIIQILFWLGVVICIYVAIYGFFTHRVFMGLLVLILGPLLVRMICEYLVVQFKINDALQEIRQIVAVQNKI